MHCNHITGKSKTPFLGHPAEASLYKQRHLLYLPCSTGASWASLYSPIVSEAEGLIVFFFSTSLYSAPASLIFCLFLFYCFSACVCLRIHTCIICVPDDNRGLKRILDSLELKLQMVVSHHLHSGNWTLSRSWPLPHFSLTICFRLYLWLVDRPMTSVFLNPNQDWQENVSFRKNFSEKRNYAANFKWKPVRSEQAPEMLRPARM